MKYFVRIERANNLEQPVPQGQESFSLESAHIHTLSDIHPKMSRFVHLDPRSKVACSLERALNKIDFYFAYVTF